MLVSTLIKKVRRYVLNSLAIAAAFCLGCQRSAAPVPPSAPATSQAIPTVTVAHPERKTLVRGIAQPGQIEPFEQTPIHAKVSGFVRSVNVDIGDPVRGPGLTGDAAQGQVLAELWVPEMEEEVRQKTALVALADAEIAQAEAARKTFQAGVESAQALVREAEAGRKRVQANFERWESEYKRLQGLVARKVIDEQTRDETLNQYKAAEASREEVDAKVFSCEAAQREATARWEKASADVEAAKARRLVAQSEERRLRALLNYATIRAPFDGVVTKRNVDTGHYLPTAGLGSVPLFVVVNLDPVRIFVDVPEIDASSIKPGMPARIRIQALKDREIAGKITRTGGILDPKTRTLRVEIDVPNADKKLLPGMYAYATIDLEYPNILSVPAAAVVKKGDSAFCYRVENGKAVRTVVQTGLSDGRRIALVKRQVSGVAWEDFTGSELIITSSVATLTDGQEVRIAAAN
jgi:HlyD family secretion protein